MFNQNLINQKSKSGIFAPKFIFLVVIVILIIAAGAFLIGKFLSKQNSQSKSTPIKLTSTTELGKLAVIPPTFNDKKYLIYPKSEVAEVTLGFTSTRLVINSNDKFDTVKSYYTKILKDNGWQAGSYLDQKDTYSLSASKGKSRVDIIITRTYTYQDTGKASPPTKAAEGPTKIAIGVPK